MPFRFGGDAVHVYLTINKHTVANPNKMLPAPDTQIYLTKDTGFSPNAELANRMLVKAAEGFFGRIKVEAFYPEH